MITMLHFLQHARISVDHDKAISAPSFTTLCYQMSYASIFPSYDT